VGGVASPRDVFLSHRAPCPAAVDARGCRVDSSTGSRERAQDLLRNASPEPKGPPCPSRSVQGCIQCGFHETWVLTERHHAHRVRGFHIAPRQRVSFSNARLAGGFNTRPGGSCGQRAGGALRGVGALGEGRRMSWIVVNSKVLEPWCPLECSLRGNHLMHRHP